MDKSVHMEMLDSIEDYTRRYTIVRGYCDIVVDTDRTSMFYSMKDNDYWVILGNLCDEAIQEVFDDSSFSIDDGIEREGCYEYKAFIYYESSTWQDPGELYVDHIDFRFIETFESRDRERKLNDLLGVGLFDSQLF